jgi:futalosine hydrolase
MKKKTSRLLVCAATFEELRTWPGEWGKLSALPSDQWEENGIRYAVTGVGVPQTLGNLLPLLERHAPAFILNIGIAGAFPESGCVVGDIIIGSSERYGDIGMEEPEPGGEREGKTAAFVPLTDVDTADFYLREMKLAAPASLIHRSKEYTCRRGRGCTVNTCTGTAKTGTRRRELLQADFETMEGAAVAQAGALFRIPVVEIRCISNMASRRSMQEKNISRALLHLSSYLEKEKGTILHESFTGNFSLSQ